MKQTRITEDGSVSVLEVPEPIPATGEVLVRSTLVGICGSDTHAIAGAHPFLYPPYIPGHEAVGRVNALGEDVSGIEVGQRVLLKPNLACGECVNCRAGRTNACQSLAWIGCDPSGKHPGAMSEFFVAPVGNLFIIPDNVSDAEAVLVECLATPVHAVKMAGDLGGKKVVVIGAGTIGLLAVIAARHAGAEEIVSVDMEEWKLERAQRYGASAGVLASVPSVSDVVSDVLVGNADVVFDCVAHEATVRQGLQILRRAGALYIVGVPPTSFCVDLPIVQDHEITVQGCAAYTAEDITDAMEIAASGGIPSGDIVTEVFTMAESASAFASASKNASGKVMVDCQ